MALFCEATAATPLHVIRAGLLHHVVAKRQDEIYGIEINTTPLQVLPRPGTLQWPPSSDPENYACIKQVELTKSAAEFLAAEIRNKQMFLSWVHSGESNYRQERRPSPKQRSERPRPQTSYTTASA